MRPKRAFLLALLVGAVGIAVIALQSPEQQAEPTPAPVAKQETPAAATVATPPAPAPVATEALVAKVERLTAEGRSNPAAGFAVYRVVADCILLQALYKSILDTGATEAIKQWEGRKAEYEECTTLPSWQRADRLHNLDIAVKADVPGAGLAYFREGPAGDWSAVESRPDDPIVVAWKKEAVEYMGRDARRGEIGAMDTMSEVYYRNSVMLPHGIAEPDDKKAAMWMEAWLMASEIRKPSLASNAWFQKTRGELVARYAGDLSEQDIKAAKAQAAEIVAQCCSPAGKGQR